MRSERVRVDTKPKGHFFVRRERHTERRHTQRKSHMIMEQEIAVMQLHTKAC